MPIILEGGFQETHTEAYPSPFAESISAFEYRGVEFGGHHGAIQVSSFTPGGPDLRSSHTEIDQRDGIVPGQDYLGSSTWGFSLFTDVQDWGEALALAGTFKGAWWDPAVRMSPMRVEPLRYHMAGRWRRVYGRPQRYAPPDGGLLTSLGRAEFEADFLVVDDRHYDDEEQDVQLNMVPATVEGFSFPLSFPIQTVERTATLRQITVGGDTDTWPRITVYGPILNPEITVGDWTLRLRGELAYDQEVVVDTAPWKMSLERLDGTVSPMRLSLDTRFSGLSLAPGYHSVLLTGTDLTGTARATIAWRDAYNSL